MHPILQPPLPLLPFINLPFHLYHRYIPAAPSSSPSNEVLNFRKTAGPRPFIPPLSEHRSSESTVSSVMLSRSHTLFPTLVPHHGAPSCPFSPSALEVVSGTAPPAPNLDPFTCSPGSPVSPKATAGHPPWSILVLTGSR